MNFYQKYELLEVLRDDGVKTFQAREASTGRVVEVHLLLGLPGKSDPPFELLEQINRIPAAEMQHLLERGEHMGTPYVVTLPLDGFGGFRDWVARKLSAAPKPNYDPMTRVGRWRIPAGLGGEVSGQHAIPSASAAPLLPDMATPVTGTPVVERAPDITAMFKTAEVVVPPKPLTEAAAMASPIAPTPTPLPPISVPAQPVPPAVSEDLDEFDRLFGTAPAAGSTAQFVVPQSSGPTITGEKEIAELRKSLPASEPEPPKPGEFTALFQTPGKTGQMKAPEVTAQTPAAAEPPKPGEFTALFQTPGKTGQMKVPEVAAQTPAAAEPPKPDEFTALFQTPGKTGQMKAPEVTAQTPAAAEPPKPGEFTALFQTPGKTGQMKVPDVTAQTPAAAEPPKTGEFTALFQAPGSVAEAPAPVPSPMPQPGEFTQMFATGQGKVVSEVVTAKTVQPEKLTATGEFTQMFQTPGMGTVQTEQKRDTPLPGEFTQMFATGQMAATPPSAAPATGEFTQQFNAPVSQSPVDPTARSVPSMPPPAAPKQEPGEFTRMFSAAPAQPFGEAPVKPSSPPAMPPPAAPIPARQEPGEFTRMFSAAPAQPFGEAPVKPAGPPAMPPPAATAPTRQEPGEFTRMFNAAPAQPFGESPVKPANPPPVAPVPPLSQPPMAASPIGKQEPGEFTRIFSAPGNLPKQPLPMAQPQGPQAGPANPFAPPTSPMAQPMVPPPPGPGQPFGHPSGFGIPPQGSPFGTPPPVGAGSIPPRPYAAPPQPSVQDEYQKLFGGGPGQLGGQAPPPMAPPQGFGGGGFGATQSFQSPAMGQMPAAPAQSEYTRMFNAPKEGSTAAPAPPPMTPSTAKKAQGAKWPIFVLGGILLLLVIGLVITLARK